MKGAALGEAQIVGVLKEVRREFPRRTAAAGSVSVMLCPTTGRRSTGLELSETRRLRQLEEERTAEEDRGDLDGLKVVLAENGRPAGDEAAH